MMKRIEGIPELPDPSQRGEITVDCYGREEEMGAFEAQAHYSAIMA